MKWISLETEVPADRLDLLLCDQLGHITTGMRAIHNDKDEYEDDGCNPFYPTHWMYLKDVPRPNRGRILNDAWVTLVAKKGLLS